MIEAIIQILDWTKIYKYFKTFLYRYVYVLFTNVFRGSDFIQYIEKSNSVAVFEC